MEKKYALLIDAENADIKYLDNIFSELQIYGNITYKRMYGDFTSSTLSQWNKKALDYAIVAIQQPHYSKYKNAADIMLVIDAMDILYAKSVDGFCIVSNDSDYTRLVNRLREAGMEVIGMGSSNASKTLKAACSEFKNLEKIFSDDVAMEKADLKKSAGEDKDSITGIDEIKRAITEMIQKNNEKAGLGGIKSSLQRRYSDFDERNYGFTTIRKLIESMHDFKIVQEDSSMYVVLKNMEYEEAEIVSYIMEVLADQDYEIGVLSNKVHERFEGFNPKNFGYSQFSKFVSGIDGVYVSRIGQRHYASTVADKPQKTKTGRKSTRKSTTAKKSAQDVVEEQLTGSEWDGQNALEKDEITKTVQTEITSTVDAGMITDDEALTETATAAGNQNTKEADSLASIEGAADAAVTSGVKITDDADDTIKSSSVTDIESTMDEDTDREQIDASATAKPKLLRRRRTYTRKTKKDTTKSGEA